MSVWYADCRHTPEIVDNIEQNVCFSYSSVPNRRVGRNKRAGGKIFRKN